MLTLEINAENIDSFKKFDDLCIKTARMIGEINQKLAKCEFSLKVSTVNFPAYIEKVDAILDRYNTEDLPSIFSCIDTEIHFSNEKYIVSFEFTPTKKQDTS